MPIEAERLRVAVEADTTKARGDLTNFQDSVGRGFSAFGSIAKGALTAVAIGAATAAGFVISNGISMNAQLELATLQFETLSGSSDFANQHVRELFEFAKRTPYETGPVIEASRMLRTFGGAALDTMENLTLVGDAAAATSAPINEVAFWMGRAYSAIQAGRPFGEAAMRLQELAILSPNARNKMEDLQKTGASSAEVWGVMTSEMSKFSGAMEKQAKTWMGLTSTLKDSISLSLADAFKPGYEGFKRILSALIDFTSSPAWAKISGFITEMATKLGMAFGVIADKISALAGKQDVFQRIVDGVKNLMSTLGPAAAVVATFGLAFSWDRIVSSFGLLNGLVPILGPGGTLVSGILALTMAFGPSRKAAISMFKDLMPPIKEVGVSLGQLAGSFGTMAAQIIADFLPLISRVLVGALSRFADLLHSVAKGVEAFALGFTHPNLKHADKLVSGIALKIFEAGQAARRAVKEVVHLGNLFLDAAKGVKVFYDHSNTAEVYTVRLGKALHQFGIDAMHAIGGFIKGVRDMGEETARSDIAKKFYDIGQRVREAFINAKQAVMDFWQGFSEAGRATTAWGRFGDAVKRVVDFIRQQLIPAAIDATMWIKDHFGGALTTVAAVMLAMKFSGMIGGFAGLTKIVTGAAKAITFFTAESGGAAAILGVLVGPIGIVAAVLAGMAVVFTTAYVSISGFRQGVNEVAGALGRGLFPILRTVGDLFSSFTGAMKKEFAPMMPGISAAFRDIGHSIAGVVEQVLALVNRALKLLKPYMPDLAKGAKEAAKELMAVVYAVGFLIEVVNRLLPLLKPVMTVFEAMEPVLRPLGRLFFQSLIPAFLAALNPIFSIGRALHGMGDAVKELKGIWHSFQDTFTAVAGTIGDVLDSLGRRVVDALTVVKEWMGGLPKWFSDRWEDIKRKTGEFATWLVGFFKDLPGRALAGLKNFGKLLYEAFVAQIALIPTLLIIAGAGIFIFFKELVPKAIGFVIEKIGDLLGLGQRLASTLWQGIQSGWDAVLGFFRDLPGNIMKFLSGAKDWLLESGKKILDGLWGGIQNGWKIALAFFVGLPFLIGGLFVGAGKWLLSAGGDIVGGLKKGLDGGKDGILNFFKDLPGHFVDWMESGLSMIKRLAGAGIDLMKGLADGLWDGAKTLVKDVLKRITKSLPDWKPKATDILVLYDNGVLLIQGLVNGIISGMPKLIGWATGLPGQLITKIGDVGSTLLGKGQDFVTGLWHGIQNVWTNTVSPWLSSFPNTVFDTIGNVGSTLLSRGSDFFTGLWHGIQNVWTGTISPFLSNFATTVFDTIGNVITTLLSRGKDFFTGLWNGVQDVWNNTLKPFFTAFPTTVFDTIGDVLGTLVSRGSDFFTGLWNGIQSFWTGTIYPWLSSFATTVFNTIGDVIGTLISKGNDFMTGLWNGIAGGWGNIAPWFSSLWSTVVTTIGNVAGALITAGNDFMVGLWNGIAGGWGNIVGWLANLWSLVVQTVGNVSGALWNAGWDILNGFWNGMKSIWNSISKWVSGLPGWFISHKGPPAKDRKLLHPAGESIMSGLLDGLRSKMGDMTGWATGLPGDIISSIGSVSKTLLGKGIDLVQGAVDGISDKTKSVMGWATSLPSNLTNWIGSVGDTLLSKGKDLVQGVLDGITNKMPNVTGWATSLPQNMVGWIGDTIGTLAEKGTNLVQGLLTGITGKTPDVVGWAQSLASNVFGWVGDTIGTLANRGTDLVQGLWTSVQNGFVAVRDWASSLGSTVFNLIGDTILTLASRGADLITGFWNAVQDGWKTVASFFSSLWSTVVQLVGNTIGALSQAGSDLIGGLWNGIQGAWIGVSNFFSTLWSAVVQAVGNTAGALSTAGADLINGLWSGVSSAWENVKKLLEGIAGAAAGLFKKVLGIGSPSKVFHGFGESMMTGLARGIHEGSAKAVSEMKNVASDISRITLPELRQLATVEAQTQMKGLAGTVRANDASGVVQNWPEKALDGRVSAAKAVAGQDSPNRPTGNQKPEVQAVHHHYGEGGTYVVQANDAGQVYRQLQRMSRRANLGGSPRAIDIKRRGDIKDNEGRAAVVKEVL